MTPQEQQLLEPFLQRLAAVNEVAKDAQADALIRQRLADQPDALYLLVQRSLLQQQALDNAKAQIAQLQAQAGGQGGGSFLGGAPGSHGGATVPPPAPDAPPPAPNATPGWRERLFGGGGANPPPMPPQGGRGAPGFLASAATTAAGVAGGMFLFEGIESLVGGHHGGGFLGGQPEVTENVTNNFYDDANPTSGHDRDAAFGDVNGADGGLADHRDLDTGGFDGDNFDDGGGFDDSGWS